MNLCYPHQILNLKSRWLIQTKLKLKKQKKNQLVNILCNNVSIIFNQFYNILSVVIFEMLVLLQKWICYTLREFTQYKLASSIISKQRCICQNYFKTLLTVLDAPDCK